MSKVGGVGLTRCQFPLFSLLTRLCPPSEFYDPGALMMEEEGAVMGGLLVGLNVLDANLCIKGEDLDSQVSDPPSSPVKNDTRTHGAILSVI